MLFYLLLAVATAILTEISFRLESRISRAITGFLSIIIPSFFYAVRYNTGTDYFNYILSYKKIKSGYDTRMEIGYVFLNKLCVALNFDVEMLFFITSVIYFIMLRRCLADNEDLLSPGLGMLVFMLMYYQISFNAARQMIAMTILLYSFGYIIRGSLIKFILCVAAAFLFHKSALIFLPAYNICGIVKRDGSIRKLMLKISTMAALIIANIDYIVPQAAEILKAGDYGKYLVPDAYIENDLGFCIRSLPFILTGVYLFITEDFDENEDAIKMAFVLYFISVILQFSVFIGGSFINRISWNYEIILVLLVPYYCKKLSYGGNLALRIMLAGYVVIHWWYVFVHSGSHHTIPYQWIYS